MAHRNDQVDISVFFVGKRLWNVPSFTEVKITFCKNRLPEFFSTGLDGIPLLQLLCPPVLPPQRYRKKDIPRWNPHLHTQSDQISDPVFEVHRDGIAHLTDGLFLQRFTTR